VTERNIMDAVRRAAVVGLFDPNDVIGRAGALEAEVLDALNALGELSDEVDAGGYRHLWILRADARRNALREMSRSEIRSLARSRGPAENDALGMAINSLLRANSPGLPRSSQASLEDYHQALLLLSPVLGEEGLALLRDVRARLARVAYRQAAKTILPTKLFGREADLKDVMRFVGKGHIASRWSPTKPENSSNRSLLITGVGGLGKSALIAAFVARLRGSNWGGRPVVLLDFDRPSLKSFDIVEFTRE
jgi:hypothetical protein